MKQFVILDGLRIPCEFRFDKTPTFFPEVEPFGFADRSEAVAISDRDWAGFLARDLPNSAETEFSALTSFLSDALIPHERILVHAVAFRFREKAYLILAPSGVGKSTQIRTLQELHPGEFGVICGDRPILRFGRSEQSEASALPASEPSVTVCPSPWNGKERWKGAEAAPLAGIILLSRGQQNGIYLAERTQAIVHTFPQMIQTGREADTIKKAAEMTTKLLSSAPVYHLVSCDIPDSTAMLYDLISGKTKAEAPKTVKPKIVSEQVRKHRDNGEKNMAYKARPGIVLTKICGVTTLLPTRAVMNECPHVQYLPLLWAETYKAICEEKPTEVILRGHEILTRQPREKVLADYLAFCKDMTEKGFLIEVEEEEKAGGA